MGIKATESAGLQMESGEAEKSKTTQPLRGALEACWPNASPSDSTETSGIFPGSD